MCRRHSEAVRRTLPHAKFRSPVQPKGDFRGKAPSAYSELRFKLKLNVCKTIRRPGTAQKEMQLGPAFPSRSHLFLILWNFVAFHEVSRGQHQLLRWTHCDLLVSY